MFVIQISKQEITKLFPFCISARFIGDLFHKIIFYNLTESDDMVQKQAVIEK